MKRVTWPEVLRCVGRDETRNLALDQIRKSRFDADSFGRLIESRRVVAEALIRTEDWLESAHPRWPEREQIRAVRRRLEVELYP